MTLARRVRALQLLPIRMFDGRVLYLDLREVMCLPYLVTGRIWEEDGETAFVRRFVRTGETAVDIGANVGWYSTLLSEMVGVSGRVYAFEPNARAHRLLVASARGYPQLHVVECALGARSEDADLYVPLDGGMGSLRSMPAVNYRQRCRMVTLDSFFELGDSPDPTLVKCDAEGAELGILRGSSRMLRSARPPLWIMEMSTETTGRFGYHPDDIVAFLKHLPDAGYRGYRLDSGDCALKALPQPIAFRFNAAFIPGWLENRVRGLGLYANEE